MGVFRGVELQDLVLGDDRVELRPWRDTDAGRAVQAMADGSIHAFLALPQPYTLADARCFIHELAASGRADGTRLECAIVDRSDGCLLGSAAVSLAGDPEIGYWVAPDARRRGVAARAARLLTTWALERGAPRVRIACDVRNVASARTALAAGFGFEGIARGAITSVGVPGGPERRGELARFARLPGDDGEPVTPVLPPLPDGRLSDGSLHLRVALPEDSDGLIESDDELTLRWSFDGVPHSEGQLRSVAAQAGLNWLVGRSGLLSMIDAESGSYAGQVSIRQTGPPGVWSLGYVVHPGFRGRGYTTRALRLVADWAFGHVGAARLELGARTGNAASQRAAENAGFAFEGVSAGRLRAADGTYDDEARWVLLNPACARCG